MNTNFNMLFDDITEKALFNIKSQLEINMVQGQALIITKIKYKIH